MEENTNKKTNWQEKLTNSLRYYFEGPDHQEYHFHLSDSGESQNNRSASPSASLTTRQIQENEKFSEVKDIFASLEVTLEYIKVKYNTLINSDIVLRDFTLSARNRQYKALLLFIDGMVDSQLINNNVLQPLMLRNRANIFDFYFCSKCVTIFFCY